MTKQTNKLVQGALLLSIAGLFTKVLSALFRIPLNHLVGIEGVGYYQTVYPFYSLLVSAAVVGIPNAVSKLISENVTKRNYYEAKKIFKIALVVIGIFGLLVSIGMITLTKYIIQASSWPQETKYALIALGLAPVFVSVAGAFKGYFQGLQIMVPTAGAQIIENVVKVIAGLATAYILLKLGYSIPIAVGGAALGTTIGFVISMFFIMSYYRRRKKDLDREIIVQKKKQHVSFKKTAKKIVLMAIPITIGSAAYSIMQFIDSLTIFHRMKLIGIGEAVTNKIMGQIGNAFTVVNVPLTISLALMISIVPAISEAVAKKNSKELNDKIILGIRLALLLALPAATGLFLLAGPLMQLLYFTQLGSEYLTLYSFCLVFIILGQTFSGILQGIGKYYYPMYTLGAAVIVKTILNYVLIPTSLQGRGAIIASIAYYMTFSILNYILIKKHVSFKLDISNVILKPLLSSVAMGGVVLFTFKALMTITGSNIISTILSVLVGVIIYGVMLILTKTLKESDIAFLPKSEKLIQRLTDKNLLHQD